MQMQGKRRSHVQRKRKEGKIRRRNPSLFPRWRIKSSLNLVLGLSRFTRTTRRRNDASISTRKCECLFLSRCVACVNRDSASTNTRRSCLRRTSLHVSFILCLRFLFCLWLQRKCEPASALPGAVIHALHKHVRN